MQDPTLIYSSCWNDYFGAITFPADEYLFAKKMIEVATEVLRDRVELRIVWYRSVVLFDDETDTIIRIKNELENLVRLFSCMHDARLCSANEEMVHTIYQTLLSLEQESELWNVIQENLKRSKQDLDVTRSDRNEPDGEVPYKIDTSKILALFNNELYKN